MRSTPLARSLLWWARSSGSPASGSVGDLKGERNWPGLTSIRLARTAAFSRALCVARSSRCAGLHAGSRESGSTSVAFRPTAPTEILLGLASRRTPGSEIAYVESNGATSTSPSPIPRLDQGRQRRHVLQRETYVARVGHSGAEDEGAHACRLAERRCHRAPPVPRPTNSERVCPHSLIYDISVAVA
jgi:hypothetical protein